MDPSVETQTAPFLPGQLLFANCQLLFCSRLVTRCTIPSQETIFVTFCGPLPILYGRFWTQGEGCEFPQSASSTARRDRSA